MCINHILLDGLGAKTFVENLASQAFHDKPLAVIPCNDRRLLAARSPPQVAFPHPEFLDLRLPIGEGSSPPVFDCPPDELEFRIFKLSPSKISELKEKAKTASDEKISSFAVVAALIWRCKAFSGGGEKDRVSTLLNVIDIRPRRNPQLPFSYSGNGVLPIGVSAPFDELEKWPFSKVVEIFSKGAQVMTDEYIKSAFDWMEEHRGLPHGDYMVSSWLRLGFDQVDYPWGKPVYCCPVVNHRKDICWVFPDSIDGGIGAMVSLSGEEMERFEGVFQELIEQLGSTN